MAKERLNENFQVICTGWIGTKYLQQKVQLLLKMEIANLVKTLQCKKELKYLNDFTREIKETRLVVLSI